MEIGRLSVETGLWHLAEYENGKVAINKKFKSFKPVSDYFKLQKRFKHLKEEEFKIIEEHRDKEWEMLLQKESN
ncbi:Oxalate oxidoreductase subunit beta [bioreactor metagenome]|uniref:Oxalate oxidoreductase subunit beta n=1 Tax=bioreactor metagenome TaxID=1076179 RepID=A0A645ISU2_9ZZZZ